MKDVNEIIFMRKKTEEDLRKYFISMVLNYKFKFVDKLEGNINIDEMYDKVKRINLHLNEWESFIQKELKILQLSYKLLLLFKLYKYNYYQFISLFI